MAELGKIEKPEASSFSSKRKLYVVPTLPFEELAMQYQLDTAKLERFWGEVREKLNYFVSTYGKISVIYLEGADETEKIGLEYFEKFGKENNHYNLIKSFIDNGSVIKGIENRNFLECSKLLFEEYSKSFMQQIQEIHEGYYGKEKNFDGWREYLVKKIQETQDEMTGLASNLIGELPSDKNAVLFITDGRPIEYPEGTDVFQIRPPAFDEMARHIREKSG